MNPLDHERRVRLLSAEALRLAGDIMGMTVVEDGPAIYRRLKALANSVRFEIETSEAMAVAGPLDWDGES